MIRFPWKVGDFLPKRKRKEGILWAPLPVLPFLGGTLDRNLCPKKCLTTSKTVMCVRGGIFRLRDQLGRLLRDGFRLGVEIVPG